MDKERDNIIINGYNNNKCKNVNQYIWKEKNNRENNETKSWFLEKISDIYKPLAKVTKVKESRYKLSILGMKESPSLETLWTLQGQ